MFEDGQRYILFGSSFNPGGTVMNLESIEIVETTLAPD